MNRKECKKGLTERANQILQDCLVKALRLREADDAAKAMPSCPLHEGLQCTFREVVHAEGALGLICPPHHERTLLRNLICRFENREYQIQTCSQGYACAVRGSPCARVSTTT